MKEISKQLKYQLINNKKNVLMYKGKLYALIDFKIETKIETPKPTFWIRKPEPVEKIYLADIVLNGYNYQGDFIGEYEYDEAYAIINHIDLYETRNNWLNFKKSLKAFGMTIIKTSELEQLKNQTNKQD